MTKDVSHSQPETSFALMTAVKGKLRKQWKAFKEAPPGQRFAEHYRRSRRQREKGSAWAKPLRWGLALVCVVIGVVLMFIPGPAILFFGIAGLIVAGDSKAVASGLDWAELKGRAIFFWGRRRWRAMGIVGKVITATVAVLLTAAAAAGMWWLWRGRG